MDWDILNSTCAPYFQGSITNPNTQLPYSQINFYEAETWYYYWFNMNKEICKKVSPYLWYGLRYHKFYTSTLFSGFHNEPSSHSQISFYEAETWYYYYVNINKEVDKKINPYLWCGLRYLKFYMSTLVLGFHHEPRYAVAA